MAPHAGGSLAAWGAGNTQIASGPGDAKARDLAEPFSGGESFQSRWQSMLRATGSDFGPDDEAEAIGAGGAHSEQARSPILKGPTPPGDATLLAQADQAAKQNGQLESSVARPAIDAFENAVSARRNSGWVEGQAIVNAKSQTMSAKGGGDLHGAHGDRNAVRAKPGWGEKKSEAATQNAAAGSAPGAGASMPAVSAPVANGTEVPLAQAKLRHAAAGEDSDGLPGSAHGWENGLKHAPGPGAIRIRSANGLSCDDEHGQRGRTRSHRLTSCPGKRCRSTSYEAA